MSELAFAAIGGFGVWLLFSAFTTPTSHRAKTPPLREQLRRAVTDWLAQAGLESVAIGEVAGAVLLVSAASGVLGGASMSRPSGRRACTHARGWPGWISSEVSFISVGLAPPAADGSVRLCARYCRCRWKRPARDRRALARG